LINVHIIVEVSHDLKLSFGECPIPCVAKTLSFLAQVPKSALEERCEPAYNLMRPVGAVVIDQQHLIFLATSWVQPRK
jgi:hypothetical protein